MTWEEVLKRTDLLGGYAVSQEDGEVYQAPISEIKEEGDVIRISSPWCARFNQSTGEWENWHVTTLSVNKDMVMPHDIGKGQVSFTMPLLGVCTLFPKGCNGVEPGKVKGLILEVIDS